MAWRRVRLLDDREVEAGVASAGSASAYATSKGVSVPTVYEALTRIRHARGEAPPGDCDWEGRLRRKPSRAEIDALAASHGVDACLERWGALPGNLRKRSTARAEGSPQS